ncbi:MAG: cyclic nucleotide-binding domain-containing protein [Tildeniella nuda ZEHNDER 1965/U140]|jgi:signal transduction histidine kinase|nr:cyclic nucleotide-binding domain-containing protein [Tildeniella nuda ZEHNDER 1965/U140]
MQVDTLRRSPLFSNLSDEQLQCIAGLGTEIKLDRGTQIAKQGDPPDGFYIILEGQTEWTRNVGGETVPAMTLGAGEVFAELILLLDEPYPTSGRTLTEVQLYKLTPDDFWKMLALCPDVMRRILKIAVQRSQIHETVTQQQAKLISLGTLSAGLAHELNNPAAAVRSNVKNLEATLQTLPSLALKLHQQPMTEKQIAFLSDLYERTTTSALRAVSLDTIAHSEAEDTITDWLEAHEVAAAWKLAPMLVTAGLDIAQLDEITTHVAPDCLGCVLTWLETTLTGIKLLEDIKLGSTRISELITAMKNYSYMDQASLQAIDVHEGIENTLTILKHKLKYGVVVEREYGALPRICAYGPQLNQVWTNLIDNAIDATNGKGHLWIRTSLEGEYILVEIADDGAGILPEVQSRIFDQFFTTKEVGKGTGLGLDIARRIVIGQHKGKISVESKPGNTRFQVRLPTNLASKTNAK